MKLKEVFIFFFWFLPVSAGVCFTSASNINGSGQIYVMVDDKEIFYDIRDNMWQEYIVRASSVGTRR